MEKWPEKIPHQFCQRGLGTAGCTCGAEAANSMHDAFMKVINEQEILEPLDNQAVLDALLLVKPVEIMTFYELDLKKIADLICSKFGTKKG